MDSSASELHEQFVRMVAGTLAIDGIELSENSKRNLDRYANGEANAQQLLEEIKDRYKQYQSGAARQVQLLFLYFTL